MSKANWVTQINIPSTLSFNFKISMVYFLKFFLEDISTFCGTAVITVLEFYGTYQNLQNVLKVKGDRLKPRKIWVVLSLVWLFTSNVI